METGQQLQSFPNRVLVAGLALLVAVLVGLAAGSVIRDGLPQSKAPAVVTETVPSWAHQGTGPTDADGGGLPQAKAPAVVTETVPSWAHQGTGPTDADAYQAEANR
jgi:hypothetical protein